MGVTAVLASLDGKKSVIGFDLLHFVQRRLVVSIHSSEYASPNYLIELSTLLSLQAGDNKYD